MSVGSTNFPGSLDTALDLVEVANKASTTVSGGTLSSGNTTVTVASTSTFTSSGIIGIDDELIAYTGKTATTFTGCTRAFESTTAASHADGAAVKQYITAASHNVQSAAIIAIETKVGSGSSTPAVNTVLAGSGTGTSAWGQVTNAMLAGSIQASKLVGTDIATVGTITSGTLSTGTVLGGVTVTLGSDATGDIYYRNSGGVLTRLGIGTTGQVLTVASGLPSWASVTASAGGTNTQLQYNSSNSLAGITGATSNGTNVTFGSGNLIATSPSITTSLTTGSTSFDLINTTATTVNFAGAATTLNMAGGSGAVINLGGGANAAELRFLEPSGSGTNYTALKAQAQAANVTYTLPAADGTSGQVLSTNGAGTLSWATASGGGGGTPGGSSGQVQYNDSSAFNGSALFTFSPTVSPNVVITANAAGSTALRVVAASSPTASIFQVTGNVTTTVHFAVTSSGAPTAPGSGLRSERFGAGSTAGSGADNTVFGANAASSVSNTDNTIIGSSSGRSVGGYFACTVVGAYAGAALNNNTGITAIGAGAARYLSSAEQCTAVGYLALQGVNAPNPVTGSNNTAIGSRAGLNMSSGAANIIIGQNALNISAAGLFTGSNNTIIGTAAHSGTVSTNISSSIVLGANAAATASNQCVVGSANADGQINDMYIGSGVTFATPVNVKINASGGSGSNIAGANLTIAGGIHTGTPAFTTPTGHVILSTSTVGAAASTANTLVQRFIVNGARKALTDATDVNLFEVALPSLTGCAGAINFEIFAADATDTQVRRGSVQYSAINKGGTYTTEIAVVSEAASVSAGTLTATWSILNGTNKITIRVNADTSLTPTTFYCVYTLENNSQQAITVV